MKTPSEIQQKIDALISHKADALEVFGLLSMSRERHAAVSAFARTLDNEIAMLRWVLGEVEQTWTDRLQLHYMDIVHYYDMLPTTEYPRLPHRQELIKKSRLDVS